MNNLARIDLNLLVTLHVLLSENTSRVPPCGCRNQPAVSHALARLRDIFGDPLLVRRAGRLELTARANELVEPLNDVLGRLGALIEPPAFDPSAATRVFRIAMSDYGARIVLPALVKTLRADAPGIELIVSQATREAMRMQLMDGEVDLALGVLPAMQRDLHAQPLFVESFACVADASRLPRRGSRSMRGSRGRMRSLRCATGWTTRSIARSRGARAAHRGDPAVLGSGERPDRRHRPRADRRAAQPRPRARRCAAARVRAAVPDRFVRVRAALARAPARRRRASGCGRRSRASRAAGSRAVWPAGRACNLQRAAISVSCRMPRAACLRDLRGTHGIHNNQERDTFP